MGNWAAHSGRVRALSAPAGRCVAPTGLTVPLPQRSRLVFFDGNSHVGLYAGNDQVLHAPDVGQFVRYTDINWLGVYSTARRY